MKEMVNISSKISKIQKAILECLYTTKGFWCHVRKISWFVAERFNREHNDRIWDAKLAKIELSKKLKGQDFLMGCRIIEGSHQKPRLLTEKHRASLSRALKRLETRGFLERFVAVKMEERDGKHFWVFYVGYGKTCHVRLTDKGKDYCSKMLTVSGAPQGDETS